MIDKIKAIPEKIAFGIGLTLILGVQILSLLLSFFFSFGIWPTRIVEGIVYFVGFLFIIGAANKRHSR